MPDADTRDDPHGRSGEPRLDDAQLQAATRAVRADALRALPRGALLGLLRAGRARLYEKGQLVYRRGDHGDGVLLLVEGRAQQRERGEGERRATRVQVIGDVLGLEAVAGLARRTSLLTLEPSTFVEIPAPLLRRAVAKSGQSGREALAALERASFEEVIVDLLENGPLGAAMSRADRQALAGQMVPRRVGRGESIARHGETPLAALFVVEGLVEVREPVGAAASTATPGRERPTRVVGFLSPGDLIDDDAILSGRPRRHDLLAMGPSVVAALSARDLRRLALTDGAALRRARRLGVAPGAEDTPTPQGTGGHEEEAALPLATRHVFEDVYRLHVARSLLVIDLETCVGCGHCAFSCASLHGVARIVRRGDALLPPETPAGGALTPSIAAPRALLLPSSCQHCELPSCLPACPTAAIGRDPSGEIAIREELCTGCEACAKACPWDNIQMAPRAAVAGHPGGPARPLVLRAGEPVVLGEQVDLAAQAPPPRLGESATVAVKCDLCRGFSAPACVDGCPVDAIVRLGPEVAASTPTRPASVGAPLLVPPPRAAWPFVLASSFLAIGLVGWGEAASHVHRVGPARGVGLGAGWASGLTIAWLLAYAARKRLVRWFVRAEPPSPPGDTARRERPMARSSVRAHFLAHLALGTLLPALVFVHARGASTEARFAWLSLRSTGGTLSLALLLATVAGAVAAAVYVLFPRRVAALSPSPRPLEEIPRELAVLEDRLFRELSGRTDLVKKIVEKVLLPYQRARLGPLRLALSGRSRRRERERVEAQIDRRLQGRGRDKRHGLDRLIALVVAHRALRAGRVLSTALLAVLPLHVVPAALVAALLLAHLLEVVIR